MTVGVFDRIKTLTGNPYHRAIYSTDILDNYVIRKAREEGIRLPSATSLDEWIYYGAYVFTPRAGINHNVMYLDLASLYPNLIRALNVGPDTLIGTQAELEASEWTEDDCVWGYIDTREVKRLESYESWRDFTNGKYKIVHDPNQSKTKWRDEPEYERCYYLKPSIKEGFLRSLIQELIDLKNQYRGTPLYDPLKANIVNAIYGFISPQGEHNSGRLAHWKIGESITLSGRKVIQYTAQTAVERVSEHYDDVYVAIGDTDGAGICCPQAATRADMQRRVGDAVEYINGDGYDEFMTEEFGIPHDHFMDVEIESYAPKLFVPSTDPMGTDKDIGVKKRYAQRITLEDLNDDEPKEVDEIAITGLEAVRSDVADVTQEAQETVFEWWLTEDRSTAKKQTFEYLRELHTEITSGEYPLEEVGKRMGLQKKLESYGTANRKAGPHKRGAKYMNEHCGTELRQGSKPMSFYVASVGGNLPATYDADTAEDGELVDCIAVEDISNIPDDITLDYEKHCRKALEQPMRPLLKTLGWQWDDVLYDTEQSGLEAYAV